jgi:3-hydroxyacyl-CoA dehydrogenase
VQARPVQSVAVIGAGTMGSGIAISALDGGFEVLLIEAEDSALARGRERVEAFYAGRVKRGRLQETVATERISRLTTSLDWQHLDSADLIIEAVFEDMGVKQDVFRRLSSVA